jgi:hypothetical protein
MRKKDAEVSNIEEEYKGKRISIPKATKPRLPKYSISTLPSFFR